MSDTVLWGHQERINSAWSDRERCGRESTISAELQRISRKEFDRLTMEGREFLTKETTSGETRMSGAPAVGSVRNQCRLLLSKW